MLMENEFQGRCSIGSVLMSVLKWFMDMYNVYMCMMMVDNGEWRGTKEGGQ